MFPSSRLRGLALVAALVTSPIVLAQAPPGYYAGVDTSSATSLRSTLHGVIDDHVRYPYTSSSTDTWDILEFADEDPNDVGRILDIYKNASYAKQGGGNSFYDREHIWPSSYGFPDDGASNYPFSDCHGLALCDSSYNSSRGNKPFRDCDPGCAEWATDLNAGVGGTSGIYPGQSNWTSGFSTFGTWETWIERRGDVARAIFYMDLRYEGGNHGVTGFAEPQLILTDDENLILNSNTGNNESIAYMGILSVLLQWHTEDPVDARELGRNDTIFSFQGNRNPFIDHPEWVAVLYDQTAAPTAAPWVNELHYDNANADVGEFVEVAGPAGLDLAGYRLIAYNGGTGLVYDTVALSGVLPDQQGCLGTLSFSFSSLQNGAPDGIALVDAVDSVIEFWSYEGSFTAQDGPAFGLTSVDMGVAESSSTPIGSSLARIGQGTSAADFTWSGPGSESPGQVNGGQTFDDACGPPPAVPSPTGLAGQTCGGFVQLTWDPVSTGQPGGYHVYRSPFSGSGYAKLTTSPVATPDYLDTSTVAGVTYFYVVTTVDLQDGESAFSAELEITATGGAGTSGAPWINEFHYDNASTDVGEFVEVAGPAGLDLAGYQLLGYNGANGLEYSAVALGGILPAEAGCVGALAFAFPSLQNGGPDGIALVDPQGTVLEFLSYEGSFAAIDGPANGLTSVDVGVEESSATPAGFSLQRAGSGSSAVDFPSWEPAQAETPATANANQTFTGGCGSAATPYGCGLNPADSLVLANGTPSPGQTLGFEITNPLGTQTPGSLTLLVVSLGPPVAFPCGLSVAGYGMASASAVGEVLVDVAPGALQPIQFGTPWGGVSQPGTRNLPLPPNCNLVGLDLYLQGAVVDPIGPNTIGLTNGLLVTIGG